MKRFNLMFILVSILFMGISIFMIFQPEEDYEITTGRIVRIDEYFDSINDSIIYTPIIDYSVDEIEYKNVEYGAYDSSMKVGDEVNVYYKADNPSNIQAEGYKNVPYVVLAISIVFLVISIFSFTRNR